MHYPTDYDPFGTLDLVTLRPLRNDIAASWSGFHFSHKLEGTSFYLPIAENEALPDLQPGTFRLPEEDVTLESLDASSSSAYDTAEDDGIATKREAQSDTEYEDLWILKEVKNAPRVGKLNSWDHFITEAHHEASTAYLTEAGAKTFDAILALQNTGDPPKIAPDGSYVNALFDLAMGRSSQYMRWDWQYREFVPTTTKLTISGYSPELLDELRDSLAAMGCVLRAITDSMFDSAIAAPSQLAYFSRLRTISTALQVFLQQQRPARPSVIQLQHLLEGPRQFVAGVEQLTSLVMSTKDDTTLLRDVLQNAQDLTARLPRCQSLVNALLSAVAGPVLARMKADLVGTPQVIAGESSTFIASWSSLLPKHLAQLVLEAEASKQLLLIMASTSAEVKTPTLMNTIELDLRFSWKELAAFQEQVNQVELEPLSRTATSGGDSVSVSSVVPVQNATMEFEHLHLDDLTPSFCGREYANLDCLVSKCFLEEVETRPAYPVPYDQVIELSLGPVIAAHHRLASFSVIRLLLTDESLDLHLNMVKQFLLLSDGSFATRVSIALFDSDQSSGEGRRRDGSTTGLRLQSRDAWPPASSELRLVLMGILTEHVPLHARSQFEETISFALRDLSDEDLEKCRDVDSIYALDFLRLHYKTPSPLLEAVITPEILDKYDRVFQHLLRLLRVQSVAQTLLREVSNRDAVRVSGIEHRFRIELQHVVSTLADYAHNTAVAHNWAEFISTINDVQGKVVANDYEGTLQAGRSLEYLRHLHEETLDSILRALLLKERQNKARRLVQELFGTVLRFAAALRRGTISTAGSRAATTKRFYDDFKTCLSSLKETLQNEGGLVEHLLLRLSM